MKKKHPLLLKTTALFLIAFILGGYFSMVSRFLGQTPLAWAQNLYVLGIAGTLFCAFFWCVFFLLDLVKKDKE